MKKNNKVAELQEAQLDKISSVNLMDIEKNINYNSLIESFDSIDIKNYVEGNITHDELIINLGLGVTEVRPFVFPDINQENLDRMINKDKNPMIEILKQEAYEQQKPLQAMAEIKEAIYEHKESTDETIILHNEEIKELKIHTSQKDKIMNIHTEQLGELVKTNKSLEKQFKELEKQTFELIEVNELFKIQIRDAEKVAKDATKDAKKANKKTKFSNIIAVISLIIAVISLFFNIL